jgi:hypothetical protein
LSERSKLLLPPLKAIWVEEHEEARAEDQGLRKEVAA